MGTLAHNNIFPVMVLFPRCVVSLTQEWNRCYINVEMSFYNPLVLRGILTIKVLLPLCHIRNDNCLAQFPI